MSMGRASFIHWHSSTHTCKHRIMRHHTAPAPSTPLPVILAAASPTTFCPCRSHSPPGRATAAAALLQFLLDYPLSPARLQGHVAFLLTNTAYEHETGRLQALELLQQVSRRHTHRTCAVGTATVVVLKSQSVLLRTSRTLVSCPFALHSSSTVGGVVLMCCCLNDAALL